MSLIYISEGPLPSVLQEVSLPIITNNECEGMYRKAGYIEHIPNIFICAGFSTGGKDSCEVRNQKLVFDHIIKKLVGTLLY